MPVDTTRKISTPVEVTVAVPVNDTAAVAVDASDSVAVVDNTPKPVPAAPVKTNTRLWKEYTDSLVKVLNTEVMKSKQIKKDTYYVSIDYEIGTDGIVNVLNVLSTPSNALLQSNVKQMLESNPPRLNPFLDSSNQPKKVKRKQNFTITKE